MLPKPPRIFVKIDIEKAYDTIEWAAGLATLINMNFPDVWIAWIRSFISSPSFFFSIN